MSEKYVGDVQVTPVEKAQSVPEEQLEEALVQKKPTVRADKLAQADPKPLVTKKGLKKNDKQVPEEAASKDRFELRKYQAVGRWTYNVQTDTCAICKQMLQEVCFECLAQGTTDVCQVAWGVCNHSYHFHCIMKWTKTRAVCPLDNTEWSTARTSD